MQLPFTAEEFFPLFRDYNRAVWPAQLFLVGLALATFVFVSWARRWSGMFISATLGFLWAWLALVYHLAFFTRINPAAYMFAGVSLAGALAFFWQGVIRRRLRFAWVGGARAFTGTALVVFALVIYPIWSWHAGRAYPYLPTFGLPCPTTIFTIGLLAFLVPPYPRSPFVVPILWCLVGTQAAFLLGVMEDLALMVAAVVGLVLLAGSKTVAAPGSRNL